MVNQHSIDTNARQTLAPSHVRPEYGAYNFAAIPGTALNLLGVPATMRLPDSVVPPGISCQQVIFLLIDGFGWNLYERLAGSSSLLRRLQREGIVSQLTAQFPSTTTAHVTTMNTSQPVGRHGMFEWHYYEPLVDAVICPFFYSYAGDQEHGTLLASGVDPPAFFPRQTIFDILKSHGVASTIFAYQSYADSPYNRTMERSATRRFAYESLPHALQLLGEAVAREQGRAYYYLHWGMVDAESHTHGPFSDAAAGELHATLDAIDSVLMPLLDGQKNVLLLIGADHGQDPVDPKQTIYLNQLIPGIAGYFRTTRGGRPIVPGGSAKDFFLYVKQEALEEVHALLRAKLTGVAEVFRVDQLIQAGYFGQAVSERFLSRVGNLVIVSQPGQTVWWYEPQRFTMQFNGHHGGLSTNEMLIPLLAWTSDR